jgi:hypothetical protein
LDDENTAAVSAVVGCDGERKQRYRHSRLTFKIGRRTSCGDSVPAVACATEAGVVEFDASRYQFRRRGKAVFGRGLAVDLDRVMAHEAGHWLGLSHHNAAGSLMNDTLGNVKCIDDELVYRLNAAVHASKPFSTPQALLYSPSTK